MERVKSVCFAVGLVLLVLSVAIVFLSVKGLFAIPSATGFEDKGIYTFLPYQVLPIQVKNTGAGGRYRRMNPTKTVYMIYYRATDGSGYQWSEQALTREIGQETVEEGVSVTRRVLSISSDRTYITVEPEQTAESYTAGLRQRYMIYLCLSVVYLLLYVLTWCVICYKKKKGI